jgi:hypothetical protein
VRYAEKVFDTGRGKCERGRRIKMNENLTSSFLHVTLCSANRGKGISNSELEVG